VKLYQGLQKASAPAEGGQKLRYEEAKINKIQTIEIEILRSDKRHSLSEQTKLKAKIHRRHYFH
jgi:hypothetical protein